MQAPTQIIYPVMHISYCWGVGLVMQAPAQMSFFPEAHIRILEAPPFLRFWDFTVFVAIYTIQLPFPSIEWSPILVLTVAQVA